MKWNIALIIGVIVVTLLLVWDMTYHARKRPATAQRTALITGSAAAKSLHEWYPPARVPERVRALAAKLEQRR